MSEKHILKTNKGEYTYIGEISKNLLNIINEERGISKEVQNEANEIYSEIDEFISNINFDYSNNKFFTLNYEFDISIFNEVIKTKIILRCFYNYNIYLQLHKKIEDYYYYNNKTKTLCLSIHIIGNKPLHFTFPTKLAHEIRHNLQYKKTNYEYLHPTSYYANLAKLKNNEPFNKDIQNIIYLSSKYEQQSYGDELYSELKFLSPDSYLDVINKCNSYLAYKTFINSINNIENNKDNKLLIDKINSFGFNDINDFINKAKYSARQFLKRLGKAISLYMDERQDSNIEII